MFEQIPDNILIKLDDENLRPELIAVLAQNNVIDEDNFGLFS